jgi:type VI secretion system ImpA family protein
VIKNARPNPYESADRGIWTKQNSDTGWPQLYEKATGALKEKSKDLQIAIWLAEASTRLHGFAGLRDSLALIRGLLEQYWDNGLFPADGDGDIEMRLSPLQWLNEKLADLLREIPITARTDQGDNYSLAYFVESRKKGGSITAEEFDAAARVTPISSLETMIEDCARADEEFRNLDRFIESKFGPELISLSYTKEAFGECHAYLENTLAQKRPRGAAVVENPTTQSPANGVVPEFGLEGTTTDTSWEEAERLVRAGRVNEALAQMTQLAATAPNGRVRFQRKLLLADICLSTQRDRLAKSILEELSELVDKHQLADWEAPQVTGAVWSRLYRCYKNEKAGIADPEKAAQLFLKLCRLDPWQALACSDGK